MKPWLIIAGSLLATIPVMAEPVDHDRVFHAAATAFDESRFDDAAALYQGMLDGGIQSGEVQFNLGNALYRSGHPGHAVLAYRRAWFLNPRDPDTQANLRFVMNETSAVMSTKNPVLGLVHRVRLSEWWGLAASSWWLMWIALAGAAVSARWRGPLLHVAALLVIITGVSGFGVYRWSQIVEAREVVVTVPAGIQALYAPLDDAEAHFELPAGSILRVRERANAWLKVSIDDRDGWIREGAVVALAQDS